MTSDMNIIIVIIIIFITPKWSKIGPKIDTKMVQNDPKIDPKEKTSPRRKKTPPRRPQNAPKTAPRRPKTPEDALRRPQDAQDGCNFFFGGVLDGSWGRLGASPVRLGGVVAHCEKV